MQEPFIDLRALSHKELESVYNRRAVALDTTFYQIKELSPEKLAMVNSLVELLRAGEMPLDALDVMRRDILRKVSDDSAKAAG